MKILLQSPHHAMEAGFKTLNNVGAEASNLLQPAIPNPTQSHYYLLRAGAAPAYFALPKQSC